MLSVRYLTEVLHYHSLALEAGLPCALIEDSGRNTSFKGVPIVSALGIGPLYPEQTKLLSQLKLLP